MQNSQPSHRAIARSKAAAGAVQSPDAATRRARGRWVREKNWSLVSLRGSRASRSTSSAADPLDSFTRIQDLETLAR